MLYLVATPIGNLADITYRAIETLQQSDYILCEDTRHSAILLNHYQIKKPLKSYHKFNETKNLEAIIYDLKQGLSISLISDAGTPGISDPGSILVQECIKEQLPVTVIPGPCAAIHAITCSGLSTERFQFVGFLPKKEQALKKVLVDCLNYPGTTLCYESPFRLKDVLSHIQNIDSHRLIVIARELSKKFEDVQRGTAEQLLKHWEDKNVKGEIILMIDGKKIEEEQEQQWSSFSPEEHVRWLEQEYSLSKQEAIKLAAKQRGVPKRDVYNQLIS